MGLLDSVLGGSRSRGGMSPLTMALMGVLAYRTMKGKGRLSDLLAGANGPGGLLSGASAGGGLGGLGGLLSGGALSGGLGALLNRFRENGQGDKAESWVSAGPNRPIAPRELEQALGPERMQWLLQQTGMTKDELLTGLSVNLPEAVDKLTPDGRIPTEAEAQRLI